MKITSKETHFPSGFLIARILPKLYALLYMAHKNVSVCDFSFKLAFKENYIETLYSIQCSSQMVTPKKQNNRKNETNTNLKLGFRLDFI